MSAIGLNVPSSLGDARYCADEQNRKRRKAEQAGYGYLNDPFLPGPDIKADLSEHGK
jgi:hypothetical protein